MRCDVMRTTLTSHAIIMIATPRKEGSSKFIGGSSGGKLIKLWQINALILRHRVERSGWGKDGKCVTRNTSISPYSLLIVLR